MHPLMLAMLLILSDTSGALAQPVSPQPLSVQERIKIERENEAALARKNDSGRRPWDKDSEGKRPWEKTSPPVVSK